MRECQAQREREDFFLETFKNNGQLFRKKNPALSLGCQDGPSGPARGNP